MRPSAINSSEPREVSPKHFARQLLVIAENRLELLMVEVQEERERLLRAILMALGVAVFGFLAGAALTVALVVVLWSLSPVAVLLTLAMLYSAASVFLYRQFAVLQRSWETLPANTGPIEKGPRMPRKLPRISPLEMRKDLLVAESELNRAQLRDQWEAATEWHRTLNAGARVAGSVASAVALLASGVRAFRAKRGLHDERVSWLQPLIKGAGLVASLCVAFRSRGSDQKEK